MKRSDFLRWLVLKYWARRPYLHSRASYWRDLSQLRQEMEMSQKYLSYLRREHARLEAEILRETRKAHPDELLIARLKKLKLAHKDQIRAWQRDLDDSQVA